MKAPLISSLFAALLLAQLSTAVRILFLFAGGNMSHKISVWPFVLGLANRGHLVTFISSHHKTPVPHANVTDLAPEALVKETLQTYNVNRFQARQAGVQGELWEQYDEVALRACDLLLKAAKSETTIREILYPPAGSHFDLLILNSVYGECGFIFATHLRTKYIVFSTTLVVPWYHTTYGIPWQASWIPNMFANFDPKPLSFLTRVSNFLYYATTATRSTAISAGIEALHARHLPESAGPTFMEMERNTSLVFISNHPAIDFARPMPPWIVQIGGMACWTPVGQLSQKFQEFMDGAQDGVILIAFGSTIDLNKLSTEHLNMFFSMMRKFSTVRFIWRWTGELPKEAPANLLAADWLPQREILNHPNIRAFMTHCGVGSVTEAACFGVPLIGVPLFADQDLQAFRIEAQDLGVYLEVGDLSQDSLNAAVNAMLTRPEYKKNMLARTGLIKDRPLSPVDTAVYWAEFVLRHDDMSAFRPMGLDQSPFVRHMFDVFLALVFAASAVPAFIMYAIVRCMRR